MDSIMFSPYGYGPLPPSAIAEIERKTAAAMRGGRFQRMLELELEKKRKMERLQSDPTFPPSSPLPSVEPSNDDSSQARRAEAFSQQQNHLTLKAAQRSVVLPPLSIAIPLSAQAEKRDQSREIETEADTEKGSENSVADEVEPVIEPLHKQVKFLAPDDEDMSDQSSICQSPSWEGYGRRKKEKKKEAERRKKEKEQAEREARAAKRRVATRLSKSPPPELNGRTSRTGGLTNADRSMSDPLLISQYLLAEPQPQDQPRDVERAISADDLQRFQPHQPAMAEVMSDHASISRRFVGGIKLDKEREAVLQSHLASHSQPSPSFPHHLMCDDSSNGQQHPRSPPSEISVSASHSSSQSSTARQEGKLARDMFPPSASRTPMLRHLSTPASHRGNSLLHGASRIFRGREGRNGGDTEAERGRYRGGNSQQHRDQSADRSMAEIAYEQLVNNGNLNSSSTRSSSRHTQNTRRSSFTQEARSVALKLAGIRTTPAAKEDPAGSKRASIHNDYFSYPEHSHHDASADAPILSEAILASESSRPTAERPVTSDDLSRGPHALRDPFASHERPTTAQSSVSSSNPSAQDSLANGQNKKNKSLREAAKAALSISRGVPPSPTHPKPPAMAPPDSTFRSRVEPQTSSPGDNVAPVKAPMAAPEAASEASTTAHHAEAAQGPSAQTSSTPPKSVVDTHVGSRVSEGSSSSSAYEDGSPLPSPATTPDTSRPQSSKDLPFIVGEIPKRPAESPTAQDDDVTLRQSSGGSSTSSTPRLVEPDTQESTEMTEEDRWSRTAIPIDIDTDAQSFKTSFSNLDNLDNIDETLTEGRKPPSSPSPPSLNPSHENSGAISPPIVSPLSETSSEGSAEPMIKIPPRSKKRDLVASRSPTSPGRMPTSPGLSTSPTGNESEPANKQEKPELGGALAMNEKALSSGFARQETSVEQKAYTLDGKAYQPEVEQLFDVGKRNPNRELAKRRHQQKLNLSEGMEQTAQSEVARQGRTGVAAATEDIPAPLSRSVAPSAASAHSEKPLFSSRGVDAYLDVAASNPYLMDLPGATRTQYATAQGSPQTRTSPPSPASPRFPRTASPFLEPTARVAAPPRMTSAPTPLLRPSSAASTRSSAPSPPASVSSYNPPASRPPPVSILKQPARSTSDPAQPPASSSRAPVLSALPKHMQLQAGMSARAGMTGGEARMAPIAKMFVECCSCRFYHDMPSKLYECMAKPDAMVEDKLLGISGAITTMVKCPWCQHNMTTSCCAGYAAVVYLKEKLH